MLEWRQFEPRVRQVQSDWKFGFSRVFRRRADVAIYFAA